MVTLRVRKKIFEWYKRPDVVRKILPYLLDREVGFLDQETRGGREMMIRRVRITTENDFIYRIMNIMETRGKVFNIYASLGSYNGGMPILTTKYMSTTEKVNKWNDWNRHHYKKMYAYDWFIDIDATSYARLDIAREDTLKIYDHLEKEGFDPSIRFSGRGFHIVVPHDQLRGIQFRPEDTNAIECMEKGFDPFIDRFNPNNPHGFYKRLFLKTKKIHEEITELVDYGLNDSKRVIKVPNTLVVNTKKTKKIYICKEISFEDLWDFDLQSYEWKP